MIALSVGFAVVYAAPSVGQTPPKITAAEASTHLGQVVTACGTVVELNCARPHRQLELSLDKMSNQGGLKIVFPVNEDEQVRTFQYDDQYYQRRICGTGLVERMDNRLLVNVKHEAGVKFEARPEPRRDPFGTDALSLCADGVTLPVTLSQTKPVFPKELRRSGRNAIVSVQGVVRSDGTVGQVRVLQSVPDAPAVSDEVIKAFKQWRFRPSIYRGSAVSTVITLEMTFSLHQ